MKVLIYLNNFCPTSLINFLTRTCQSTKDQIANIYTGSSYAFGMADNFRILLEQQGFLIFSGQPIKNGKWVAKLLDVIQKWKQLAIIKIPGLSKAGAAARQAASNSQVIQR